MTGCWAGLGYASGTFGCGTSKQWMDGLEGRDFGLEHALLGRGGGYTYDFMIESLHTLYL